ncbi:hypothetical protein Clacol_007376 [Clathrus columnatus]|uniref:TPX2 C-terminal domain-containing protein n=1 Tax=Clathrus columnatus TaxID=1419009 RepID=A0AAV5AEQ9_9AGAM|nr:hypothetical protein Clacol_007376 [Clathrus columnatus]
MNRRNYFEDNVTNVYDTSFQINPGICADQSQLNELDIDFDVFDETNPYGDPFATPMPSTKDKPFSIEDFPKISGPLQSTSPPPKASTSFSHAGPLDESSKMNNSLLHVFERPVVSDDFFDVRKRNGNISNGLDLTSKSTARLWKAKGKKITPEEFEAVVQSKLLVTYPSSLPSPTEPNVPTSIVEPDPDPPVAEEAILPLELKPKPKHPEIVKDAGVTKSKPIKPKPILRNAKPTRVMTLTSKTSKPEKQELGEKEKTEHKDRRQSSGSLASIGGGLMDVLMSYGEKIRNSFGISSNSSRESESSLLIEDRQCDAVEDMVQLSTEPDIPTEKNQGGPSMKEADANPSLPLADGSLPQNREDIVLDSTETVPTRTSKKRLLPFSPSRERKRKCLQDENASDPRSNFDSADGKKLLPGDGRTEKPISRPRPLGASKAANKAIDNRGYDKLKTSRTMGAIRLGKASAVGPRRNEGPRPVTSSVSGPLFASDVYRQLALEKAQKEQSSATTHFSKPVPPARPALRPTIPAAFVFRSEERIAQRHAEADDKIKVVEEHLVPFDTSVKTQADQTRKKTSNPILPTDAPVLNTLIRAKAREKFDAERKEREKILELQRLIRERERAEQEEREYKEARKRTIPRAHEVPEWYKDVGHRRKDPE